MLSALTVSYSLYYFSWVLNFSANTSCKDFFLKEFAKHRRWVTSNQLGEGYLSSLGEEETGVFPQGIQVVCIDIVTACCRVGIAWQRCFRN